MGRPHEVGLATPGVDRGGPARPRRSAAADSSHADQADNATNAQNAGDANTLDGKDSADFIQRNPSAAQNGSIHIDGTMRTGGMLRTGSETGTSQLPNQTGLVVRRINSTNSGEGQVVARTDELRLERDGSFAGLRIAWDANTNNDNTVNCMGVSTTEAAVTRHIVPVRSQAAGTAPVFTAEQNVVYATCSFGDSRSASHTTQVTLQRRGGNNSWVGTVTSTFNQ